MSTIKVDKCGFTPRDTEQNWAAEYARRLLTDEETERKAALSEHKSQTPIDHPDGSVTTAKLAGGAVTSEKINARAVTRTCIAQKAVGTDQIDDNAVTARTIADGACNGFKIGAGAVTEIKIGIKAVTTSRLADRAVTEEKIAQKAVGTDEIADKAVNTRTIADRAVTGYQLATGAVNYGHIVNDAVINSKIANDAVTNGKIANGAVTTHKIGASAVTEDKLANNSVTMGKLAEDVRQRFDYSETPVEVGAWIDGTPIWRKAFEVDYDSLRNKDVISENDIGLSYTNPRERVFAVGRYCVARLKDQSVSSLGDSVPEYNENNSETAYLFDIRKMNDVVKNLIKQKGAKFYGWVDFATDETNIDH